MNRRPDDDDEYDRPRRRRRRDDDEDDSDLNIARRTRRPSANISPFAPALGLLILAVLHVFIAIYGMAVQLGFFGDPPNRDRVLNVLVSLFLLACQLLIVAGAIQMMRRRTYVLCMVTAVLSVIPCLSPMVFFGIPFGIWALVLLCMPDCKNSFAEEEPDD